LGSTRNAQAVRDEDVSPGQLVWHADSGAPLKSATMLATLQRLGIAASFSRPNVSDDNAACEAIYPRKPFASINDARKWVEHFVAWYKPRAPPQRAPLRHAERSSPWSRQGNPRRSAQAVPRCPDGHPAPLDGTNPQLDARRRRHTESEGISN